MENYKKLGAIGGAISLALCWPLAVGQIGQSIIESGIAEINSDEIKAEIVSYDRGYLSSVVLTRYTVIDAEIKSQLENEGIPTSYDVQSDLTHGLTSLTADSELMGENFIAITMNSTTQLNGNTTFSLNLDRWNHHNQSKGTTVSSSPIIMNGEATILGDITYQLDLPSIQIDFNNGEEIHLSGLTGQGKGKKTDGYWLGNQSFSLQKLEALDTQQAPTFILENAQYSAKSVLNETGDKIDSSLLLDAKHVTESNGNVIENFAFDMAINGIDRSELANITSIYQRSDDINKQETQALLSSLDSLVNQGLELNVNDFSFTLNGSKTHSQWLLKALPGVKSVTQDPIQLLSMITGSINTYVASGLTQSNPMLKEGVDNLIAMDLVEEREGGYQLNARISEGNLTLDNGKELPLVSLLFSAMRGQ
ncbi:hypothetical protein BS333_05405 [Vibrio azureus]|uniref:DUF945 domain-containing protein n=1 Tax=Vibrio azureus NBRC 104587 TaxID=1219077 RepID=U3C9F0_9VIBR|nr:DUF945 family protein [Vibrio azureus]AUI85859.1 hypothetical protein BS333_05405 [Vibrio azureus]GAD77989.1 hypothetical protein VAZ01S_106_00040 [Vibrio azureus NBRC 104587]